MKQKDIITIVVVTVFSGIFSLIISSVFITPPKNRSSKVEVVQKISSEFPIPENEDKYFNKNSINPTQLITIGSDANTNPFNGSQ